MCKKRSVLERILFPECVKNSNRKIPSNQIIPGRDIYYIVGQQIIDERLDTNDYGEVLYGLPKAQKAFLYGTRIGLYKGWRSEIDIGLLIVNIQPWDNRPSVLGKVRALDLPDKG